MENSVEDAIISVIVVGFHHKKGCQVEYSFPPLVPGSPNECPVGWKYLPTLALPDGSHNYDKDTAFFHLPSLKNPKKTVYGISCYRQIPVEKIKNVTSDITRGTVQKAVCVLSNLPLFGHIQVKMELITHAYFEEGDFSKVSILEETYHHLNNCLNNQAAQQNFVGLSAREFIFQWRHKAVLLFKLLLLEKRIIFFRSPVLPLCSSILTLLSLHPGMIEKGLEQSACIKLSRPMSPMPEYEEENSEPDDQLTSENKTTYGDTMKSSDEIATPSIERVELGNVQIDTPDESCLPENSMLGNTFKNGSAAGDDCSAEEKEGDASFDDTANRSMQCLYNVSAERCGAPLDVFSDGYLCLPYLSLPYIDLLADANVRGYVVGATNVLFKQKRQLADVLVDVEYGRIESHDLDLRRQLHLTTEDLRFADFIVRHVADERHDVFLDGVDWEGGDEWIRSQFKVYLLYLLRTSLLQDGSRELEHFNASFISAWRDTHNYKVWFTTFRNNGILEVNPGHPFAGQLSVADMKLRLAHTMQNTEGGRKLNQAMATTGRAVATTGRAVGGAISQAKGALSNWWSNLAINQENKVENKASDEVDYSNANGLDSADECQEEKEKKTEERKE